MAIVKGSFVLVRKAYKSVNLSKKFSTSISVAISVKKSRRVSNSTAWKTKTSLS